VDLTVADAADDAQRHFELGYRAQMAGRLEEAITRYRESIAIRPTAEAHTFLGWTYSFQKRWDDAIAECHAAIDVDPDFGNPYNDIGVYLIELGRLSEAVPWLERAKRAPRYEPRHYPYFNLARIYAAQHKVREAVRELEQAIALQPGYRAARTELHRLIGLLN
jgi:tetratricopeptide (TPR) repeat protein